MLVALAVGRRDGELQTVGARRGRLVGQGIADAKPLALGDGHLPLGLKHIGVGEGEHHQPLAILPADPTFDRLCQRLQDILTGEGIPTQQALKNLEKVRREHFQELYGKE